MNFWLSVLIPIFITVVATFIIFILGMKNKNLKDVYSEKFDGNQKLYGEKLNSQQKLYEEKLDNVKSVNDKEIEGICKRLDNVETLEKDIMNLDKKTAVDKEKMEGKLSTVLIELGTKINSLQSELSNVGTILNQLIERSE